MSGGCSHQDGCSSLASCSSALPALWSHAVVSPETHGPRAAACSWCCCPLCAPAECQDGYEPNNDQKTFCKEKEDDDDDDKDKDD